MKVEREVVYSYRVSLVVTIETVRECDPRAGAVSSRPEARWVLLFAVRAKSSRATPSAPRPGRVRPSLCVVYSLAYSTRPYRTLCRHSYLLAAPALCMANSEAPAGRL